MAANGLVHIAKQTFSAVSSVSFDDCFSSSYNVYRLQGSFNGSSSLSSVDMTLRVGGVNATGSDYTRVVITGDGTGITQSKNTLSVFRSFVGYTETGSRSTYSEIWLFNPADTTYTTGLANIMYDSNGSTLTIKHTQVHALSTSYDGFSILPQSGTITGNFNVWGLAL